VTWEDKDSCAEGYQINNDDLQKCEICEDGYSIFKFSKTIYGCFKNDEGFELEHYLRSSCEEG
jgi:hypothetical protein